MADAVGAGASSRRGVGAAQPHKIPVNPAVAKKSTRRGEQNREVDDKNKPTRASQTYLSEGALALG